MTGVIYLLHVKELEIRAMNRNFHNSRGSSTRDGNQNPRWRIIFLALVSALVIGSAGQTPLARAAPAGATSLMFYMRAAKEREGLVCRGELVHISVKVHRVAEDVGGDELANLDAAVTGVEVRGLVQNNIGELTPNNNTTIAAGAITPNSADFIFTAREIGETTISFRGLVVTPGWFGTNWGGGSQAVSAFVHVQVIPCAYKVTTEGAWRVPGPANISVAAISDDAKVRAADAQSPFTGSTTVNWVLTTSQVGDCEAQSVTTSSQVDWTGQMDDSGQLNLNGAYQSAAMSLPVYCVGSDGGVASGSTPVQLTPDPLQVSIASTGGVFRQSQVLQGPEPTPGYVTIIVVPEEEAVAFNTDSGAFLSPSAWWAILWDNFPSLYNSVLALR